MHTWCVLPTRIKYVSKQKTLAPHEYTRSTDIRLLSFNMHGFYQELPVLEDLINAENPVIILSQEHRLTPNNLTKF